jgi:hypothetical protein
MNQKLASSDPQAHQQAIADADDADPGPGPDHWTRDDIDAAVGALCSIADDMQKIAALADTIMAQAVGQTLPNAGG